MIWDQEKIQTILPHRKPFLFIDHINEINGNHYVAASKKFSGDEFFFTGHFPDKPIVPGAILIEAMAQTSIFIYYLNKPAIANSHPDYYLGKIKAEFFTPIRPGDEISIEASLVKVIDTAGIVDTQVRFKGEIAAKANIVFGVKPVDK